MLDLYLIKINQRFSRHKLHKIIGYDLKMYNQATAINTNFLRDTLKY